MKALSKVILMQKKFTRLEQELLSPRLGCNPCKMVIKHYSPGYIGTEDHCSYPETIMVTFNNWSTSHFEIRVSDCRWIPEGDDLDGPGLSGYQVLREQLQELKQFEEFRNKNIRQKPSLRAVK